MRPPRFRMKRNHCTEIPSQLVFFDTETHSEKIPGRIPKQVLRFKLGAAIACRFDNGKFTRREEFTFSTTADFWNWLEEIQSVSRPVWAFAHNLNFDLAILDFWSLLDSGRYRVDTVDPKASPELIKGKRPFRGRMVLESRPCFIYSLGKHGRVKFVDSFNYFDTSLKTIGEWSGVPKKEINLETATHDELLDYCLQDVKVLESAMCSLLLKWSETDCGVWQPTAPMLALTSFRHRLPNPNPKNPDSTITFDEKSDWVPLEREAYYGGQVECFYVGEIASRSDLCEPLRLAEGEVTPDLPQGPIFHIDVNGLYPHVMKTYKFPVKRLFHKFKVPVAQLERWIPALGLCARVKIKDFENTYTTRHNGQQVQAQGIYWTALCGPELERAIENGSIIECAEVQGYAMDRLFGHWVDYWFQRRLAAKQKHDRMEDAFCKLILNSLSGKFAQHGKKWSEVQDHPCRCRWGEWREFDHDSKVLRRFRGVAGTVQEQTDGEPPWYSFPAISAWITAHGREWMRWARSLCPAKSVYYQATDGLLVSVDALQQLQKLHLLDQTELGKFKEKSQHASGEIVGCNHYRIDDLWVRAGSWGRARSDGNGGFTFLAFQGIHSVISSKPNGTIEILEYPLEKVKDYTKGIVTGEGWTTPLQLPVAPLG